MPLSGRYRVLFFAEGATLAHVARPFLLARGLDPASFDVTVARPDAFARLSDQDDFRVVDLACQDAKVFSRRLDRGLPLYDIATLEAYVGADLELIDRCRPDIVIGDFRLSLSVSARLRKVPYIAICDAYWSPESPLTPLLPVMSFTPYVPLPMAAALFRRVAPLAFWLHAMPMERLRKRHGLPSLGHDLRYCYTDADLRLFANFPALFPEIRRTATADFVGPVAWSPPDRADLRFPEGEGPLAYVTMGSSGDSRVLGALIPVLEDAGFRIMLAAAGKRLPAAMASPRTFVHEFLPGDQVCRQAQLVVCNGGSPTTNQALTHGVPVLGIARNMDQFLNMRAIERYGAGVTLRSDRVDRSSVAAALALLTQDGAPAGRARTLACSSDAGPVLANHIKTMVQVR